LLSSCFFYFFVVKPLLLPWVSLIICSCHHSSSSAIYSPTTHNGHGVGSHVRRQKIKKDTAPSNTSKHQPTLGRQLIHNRQARQKERQQQSLINSTIPQSTDSELKDLSRTCIPKKIRIHKTSHPPSLFKEPKPHILVSFHFRKPSFSKRCVGTTHTPSCVSTLLSASPASVSRPA